jgi:cytochrome c-type biogenesis protein CcmH/NrfF
VIRRALLVLGLALLLLAPAGQLAHAAPAPTPRTTLVDVEDEVMCVLCGTALNISESAQADRERAFIKRQIAMGKTKQQVKQALVGEYGEAVLGTPSGGGFNAAAWIVPAAIVLALLAALALIVPRWRRRARSARDVPAVAATPALSSADARRLEEDIARYER